MELMNLNHPDSHKCAFCKHWYDPMNQAIRPKAPIVGFWEYDPLAENQCMVRNMKTEVYSRAISLSVRFEKGVRK